jgi:predicted nucleic acid-binding protein
LLWRRHRFQPVLQRLFSSSDNANLFLQTSTITLLEVLVKPLKEGRQDLVEQYKEILLNAPGMTVRAVDSNVAETAGGLRAQYGLRTPDALQLGTAIYYRSSFFLTNDKQLAKVKEIPVLLLSDLQ